MRLERALLSSWLKHLGGRTLPAFLAGLTVFLWVSPSC
jgi:hypothetical protein